MANKFKVGDRVKISARYFDSNVHGWEGVIRYVPNDEARYYELIGQADGFYTECELEFVDPPKSAFDPTKPVQTRDGHPARIICTDVKGTGPIIALVEYDNKNESCYYYNADGSYYGAKRNQLDLINVPIKKKIKRWLKIHGDGSINVYHDRDHFSTNPAFNLDLVAVKEIEIEYEEGEGLNR